MAFVHRVWGGMPCLNAFCKQEWWHFWGGLPLSGLKVQVCLEQLALGGPFQHMNVLLIDLRHSCLNVIAQKQIQPAAPAA